MSAFFDYLRNITYYLLFASLVGLIAPTGKYRKYVNWVMGLVLLVLLLQPIMMVFNTQIPVTQWFDGMLTSTHVEESNYENWRDIHLAAAFEEQLRAQVNGLLSQQNIILHDVEFSYSDDFSRITFIRLSVSQEEESQRVPFIRIEPVQINREEQAEACPISTDAKNLISEFYNLPLSHINVIVQN